MKHKKSSLRKEKKTPRKRYSKRNHRKKSLGKLLFFLWLFFFLGIAVVFGFFYLLSKGHIVNLPDAAALENPSLSLTSKIISVDGKVLGRFYKENRSPVSYDELSKNLVDALIATEDNRFYNHSGIDYLGVARAIAKLGKNGGGSTITQQLAKMLFTGQRDHRKLNVIMQKLGEWVLSVQLEKRFTKEEILALYFNKFQFAWNANGIKNSSRLFFDKEPKDLKIEEAAVLVGMLKSPSRYNPRNHPERAKLRREVVLKQMLRNKKLTQNEYDSLRLLPLTLHYKAFNSKIGNTTYFREYLKNEIIRILLGEEVKKIDGTAYNLFSDGLKIYTTIDSRMQRNAEQAIKKHLTRYQKLFNREKNWNKKFPFHGKKIGPKMIDSIMMQAVRLTNRYKTLRKKGLPVKTILSIFKKPVKMNIFSWRGSIDTLMSPWDSIRYNKSILQAGLMSMDPGLGYVKAWVGGIDFKHFKYDHVKRGRRQIGSTFKPFVYVTAISEKHYSPCTMISNEPFEYKGTSKVVYGEGGEVSLETGLARSLNPVALRLIETTTTKPVIQICKDLGITSPLPPYPSIALGTADISLYEMVAAYGAFANKGIYTKPVVIWRIEDKNGRILYENKPKTREVFSEDVAYTMIKIMEGSIDHPQGTSKRLRYQYGFKNKIACKTGTTDSNSDAWFIGFVPNLVTGVWVGNEDRSAHFSSTANGQGAAMALPIWAYYMQNNYRDKELGTSDDDFQVPSTKSDIDFDCTNYNDFHALRDREKVRADSIDINTQIQKKTKKAEDLFD